MKSEHAIMEITVIEEDKTRRYKIISEENEDFNFDLIAFFQGNLLELSSGRRCVYYYHEKKHRSIPLKTRSEQALEDLCDLEGLVIDFKTGRVEEFLNIFDEDERRQHIGEGYKEWHPNFTAITYYSLDWGWCPPVKALFIRKVREI